MATDRSLSDGTALAEGADLGPGISQTVIADGAASRVLIEFKDGEQARDEPQRLRKVFGKLT